MSQNKKGSKKLDNQCPILQKTKNTYIEIQIQVTTLKPRGTNQFSFPRKERQKKRSALADRSSKNGLN